MLKDILVSELWGSTSVMYIRGSAPDHTAPWCLWVHLCLLSLSKSISLHSLCQLLLLDSGAVLVEWVYMKSAPKSSSPHSKKCFGVERRSGWSLMSHTQLLSKIYVHNWKLIENKTVAFLFWMHCTVFYFPFISVLQLFSSHVFSPRRPCYK